MLLVISTLSAEKFTNRHLFLEAPYDDKVCLRWMFHYTKWGWPSRGGAVLYFSRMKPNVCNALKVSQNRKRKSGADTGFPEGGVGGKEHSQVPPPPRLGHCLRDVIHPTKN